MKTYMQRYTAILTTSLIVASATLSAQEEKLWDNTAGGDFSEATNWSPSGIPASADQLIFNLDADFSVGFGESHSATSVSVRNGSVTFDISSFNLSLSDSLRIGADETAATTSALTVSSGTINTSHFTIGSSGKTGTLDLSGDNTTVNATGSTSVIGDAASSMGTLNINDGATVTTQSLTLSNSGNTQGTINISGTASSLSTSGLFTVGRRSNAYLNITNGATVSAVRSDSNLTNPSMIVGNRPGTSIVTVDDGTLNVGSSLRVGDSISNATGNGRLIGKNGAKITIQNELVIGIGNGSGTGEVFISGADTTLEVQAEGGGGSWIGGRGGDEGSLGATGHLRVTDGAVARFGSALNLNRNGTITVGDASIRTTALYVRESTGILEFILGTGYSDPLIHVTTSSASLSMDGDDASLNIVLGDGFISAIDETFTLIRYDNNLLGQFEGFTEGDLIEIDGYTFAISYGTGNNSAITLNTVAIPEPAAFATLFGTLTLLLLYQRQKKN